MFLDSKVTDKDAAKSKITDQEQTKIKVFIASYEPCEWYVFLYCGIAAPHFCAGIGDRRFLISLRNEPPKDVKVKLLINTETDSTTLSGLI